METATRYVVPEEQNVAINWNEVTNVTVTNTLKKFRVNVVKSDAETGTAQGNATLAGAVYGIYDGETLVDTYTTDAEGKFTTTYYVCGDDWSIREITPSEGYLLDEKVHHVGAEAKNYEVERNTTSNDVTEQVEQESYEGDISNGLYLNISEGINNKDVPLNSFSLTKVVTADGEVTSSNDIISNFIIKVTNTLWEITQCLII